MQGVRAGALAGILHKYPQILALSVDLRIKVTVRYLVRQLELTPEETGKLLTAAPSLIGQHPQRSLEPKLAFLSCVVGMEPAMVKRTILRAPILLAHSLEGKLKYNVDFLVNVVGV